MHSIRLSSRVRNGELAPLLDDDITAVVQEEERRETRAEINRVIRDVAAELADESEREEPKGRETRTSNVVPLRRTAMRDQGDTEAA